jgi:hypothetical protein
MSKDAPCNASELVGERDGEDVVMQPLLGRFEPRLEPVTIPARGLDQYNPCGLVEQNDAHSRHPAAQELSTIKGALQSARNAWRTNSAFPCAIHVTWTRRHKTAPEDKALI